MAEFQLADDTPENEKKLLDVIRFVQKNPEGKRAQVECPEHGSQTVIIIDGGSGTPITFTGCCQVAIDMRRNLIGWVMPFNQVETRFE